MIKLEKIISIEKLINEARHYKSEELDLSYCALQVIPEEVFDLKHLKVLKLIGNRLKTLPKEIGNLRYLTHLYLHKNYISDISDEVIDSIKYIECFDLGDNPIRNDESKLNRVFERMEKWMGYKKCLLKIRECKEKKADFFYFSSEIEILPNEIYELEDLKYLHLHGNGITEIPEGISKLKNLISIDFSDNQISKLPKDIIELKNLISLSLNDNNFIEFPDIILEIPNLILFDISKNKLMDINRRIFEKPSIKSFYAFENPFINFDDKIFYCSFKELRAFFAK